MKIMKMRSIRLVLSVFLLTAFNFGCAHWSVDSEQNSFAYSAKIRRTAGGIPHIQAEDLPSLGFGTIYAQAEDNVCILADQYLTFGAERSRHLGEGDGNLESDLFHQFLIDRGDAAEPLPDDLEALFAGAAAGYNHFLRSRGVGDAWVPSCFGSDWLREAEPIDLKRVSRVDYALAYMRPIIVAAAPPKSGSGAVRQGVNAPARADARPTPVQVAALVEAYLEVPKHGGSNGVAIGRDASFGGTGGLLANPHMPWNEPFQRFYPMHQIIPGELDVMGANLIGRPRVGFGHTEHVAWTSTVSRAKRLSFYRLELDPSDTTAYLFDGESVPMTRHLVTVPILTEGGEIRDVSHTFYETHFGALLVESPFFAWTTESAFAVRLLDAAWRGETSLTDQYAATSVRELKAVHDRDQFLPVNLIAADRSGEVLFADPGPIPNLPDDLIEGCAVLRGAALDGSRSECQWRNSPGAAAPGIFPPSALPERFRTDYVTNSNDSYWLPNPAAPIEGLAGWMGTVGTARTLRTRSGLQMVAREIEENGAVSLDGLRSLALANENFAGQLIRDDVVLFCRETPEVTLSDERTVALGAACTALAEWDLHANLESRGAILFRHLLASANGGEYTRGLPLEFTPRVPFDVDQPVKTPRGLAASSKPVVLEHLAKAVVTLEEARIALDARLGEFQSVTRKGIQIPLHGGPEFEGIFNKIESDFRGGEGYSEVDRWSSSWILAVEFLEEGPRSFGILTYSLSADADSPHFSDQTQLFSKKEWVSLPFRDAEIEAGAERSYTVRGGP
jgi:acyl-homoserine-lactone acylase